MSRLCMTKELAFGNVTRRFLRDFGSSERVQDSPWPFSEQPSDPSLLCCSASAAVVLSKTVMPNKSRKGLTSFMMTGRSCYLN